MSTKNLARTVIEGGRRHASRFDRRRSNSLERSWERVELGLGLALPFRGDVLWMTLAGGSDLGSGAFVVGRGDPHAATHLVCGHHGFYQRADNPQRKITPLNNSHI